MTKTSLRITCLALMLLALLPPTWALEPVGSASETVLQLLQEQGNAEPTAEDLVAALNRATVNLYQDGKYVRTEIVAREALNLAERDLDQEHPEMLTALNNLAFLYKAQGHYGKAEPLYLRTLEARERTLGQDHPDTLISVNNLARLYQTQSRYDEAESLFVRALEANKRVLGKDHPQTLSSLANLAELYRAQGRYDEAKPRIIRALEARERTLGRDHPDTLTGLDTLARLYQDQGRYDEAEPLFVRTLKAREQVLSQNHPQILLSINNLAALYYEQGRFGEAEPLLAHVLEARRRILGQDHPDTLGSLNNLAGLYQAQGRFVEAEPLYELTLEANKRTLGQDHPQTFVSAGNMAKLYYAQGRYGEAESLLAYVLEARERILGQDHPDTLGSLNNLAGLYQAQGRYDEAEPLYLRALESSERVLDQDHPDTLTSVSNLAALYQAQGRHGEAEPLYLRVLDIHERTLGRNHPDTLVGLHNLATLYQAQSRYGEAEPLYARALEARERILGQDHPDTLLSINNLARLYQAQGRSAEAEPLYERVLEAQERVLGQDHPDTLTSINNLALLYNAQGRYDEAKPLYLRVLEASERTLGQDHPQTLTSLNNLAGLYGAQDRYDEAEPLLVRALESSEQVLGQDHPQTLGIQLNLAVVLINSGQRDRALQELRRVDEHLRGFVGDQIATTHRERVRRRWLVSESNFQHVVFSLALRHPGPDSLRLAADVLLRWKRLAGEAEALIARLARTSQDSRVIKTAKALSKHRAALSRLVNLPVPDQEAAVTARKQAITEARAAVERLEVELAGLSRKFQGHVANRAVGWEQVRSELPDGSALLSLRAFRPFDFTTRDYGEPHWLALLIPADPGDGPELVLNDLGPIAPMEAMHKELRDTGSKESARTLYERLFGQLDAELVKYDRLYIAADGLLDLVAFARLVVPDGRYWIQRQELHQVQTGRDLIRPDSIPASAAKGMVIYGGIDYAACPESGCSARDKRGVDPSVTSKIAGEDRMSAMNRRLLGEKCCFEPLGFSGPEAKAIGQFYLDPDGQKAQVWLGREASETRFKTRLEPLASPPRILHLATHGFFLDEKTDHTERPMTLAGLALAGANAGIQGQLGPAGEDGVLYAQEVLDLNLEGTELITLSACDTGKGEVDYSEGVYGLVRAFRIAGARNLLMTLWSLDDPLAYSFMREFYLKWFEDPDRHPAQALRETQLAWIRDQDSERSDPNYWAPYVLIEGR